MIETISNHSPKAVSTMSAWRPARRIAPRIPGMMITAGSSRRIIVPPLLSLATTAMMPWAGRAHSTPIDTIMNISAVGSAIAICEPMP